MEFFDYVFLDNTLRTWLVALVITTFVFLGIRFVAMNVVGRLAQVASRTTVRWDDVLSAALGATKSMLLFMIGLFMGASVLTLPERGMAFITSLTVIALLVQAGLWLSAGLTAWLSERGKERLADDPAAVMTMHLIGVMVRIGIWSMVLLMALDNLGIDVTALVAGLGIGGVAIALAAQSILGDLFASLSIVFDKPFVLGDFLNVGDFLGTVEAIGLKTTRVRSLSGEQVVFSNKDLLESRIRNFGRMFERRVVSKIGVTYQTPRKELEAIPGLVRAAVEANDDELVRFDRSHMSGYGDFAIMFETVYYVLSPDFNVHMDIQQAILLDIHREFEARGIEFAYPTQTLFLERSAEAS